MLVNTFSPSRCRRRCLTYLTAGTLSLLVVTAPAIPAFADIFDDLGGQTGDLFDNVGNQIDNAISAYLNNLFGSIQNQIQQEITERIQGVLDDTIGSVMGEIMGGEADSGEFGIPDPDKVHKKLNELLAEVDPTGALSGNPQTDEVAAQDQFNSNPVVQAQSLGNAADREVARGLGSSVLSEDGQKAMAFEMDAATETLQAIAEKSQSAQSMDVTQDVMKNLTALTAMSSQLDAGSYAQLMQLRQQAAANNIITSNISEALDEANRAQHAIAMAEASIVAAHTFNVYLPATR